MTDFSPFEPSLWYATACEAPQTQSLNEEIACDVCIVGAGYTGLTTAIELSRRGVSVSVVEAREAGFGGSGRNAGHCTPTFAFLSLDQVRGHLGAERARRLIARQTGGADLAADYIRTYQISCEWKQNGFFQGILCPSQRAGLEAKCNGYAAAGCPSEMVDAAEAQRLTGSPRFLGGWMLRSGGHLNPLGYARGLARAAMQEGARIFTDTPMQELVREGSRWRVRTPGGSVLADRVIVATGAYTQGGGTGVERSYRILRALIAATNPLPAEARRRIVPFDGTMHDGRGDIFVYKYDAAGRIVASMFPMGRRGRDLDYTREMFLDRLRWLHPDLPADTRWDFYWSGELDMQRHTIPRLYDLGPGAVACTGLSGRGVPTGTMLGGILADWAQGTAEPDLALPVEPLRSAPAYMAIAPAMMLRWYRFRDRLAARRNGSALPPHA
ncbi:MAG: FAD-binding oxidoreductase [Geminicoccaceae bacterium]